MPSTLAVSLSKPGRRVQQESASPQTKPSCNPFNRLPFEIVQHIAFCIEGDLDLANFRLACRSADDVVDDSHQYFWQQRFNDTFHPRTDVAKYNTKGDWRLEYSRRKYHLKHGAQFELGRTQREIACLEVIRDLIGESLVPIRRGEMTIESPNLGHIQRFLSANGLMNSMFFPEHTCSENDSRCECHGRSYPPTQLLSAVRVVMLPYLLENVAPDFDHFRSGQVRAYQPSMLQHFFLADWEFLWLWMLENLCFWHVHLASGNFSPLTQAYRQLDQINKLRWWSETTKTPESTSDFPLGRRWKGTHTYLDLEKLQDVRSGNYEWTQDSVPDEDTGNVIHDFELLPVAENDLYWPEHFQTALPSLDSVQARRCIPISGPGFRIYTEPHNISRDASLADGGPALGRVEPLPPQEEISGWQRLTMIKYDDQSHGPNNLFWAYEGIVLPGGRAVIGKWWDPNDLALHERQSGPFIMWCVD